jgi:hypothetical protein|tara:strand:+ start:57517 stop:57741 length:225 start_codon:yes stop_codon:yes gene_type:complete
MGGTDNEFTEKSRKAFQQWYEDDSLPLEHSNWFRRDEDMDYIINHVDAAWRGWHAAYNHVVDTEYNNFKQQEEL